MDCHNYSTNDRTHEDPIPLQERPQCDKCPQTAWIGNLGDYRTGGLRAINRDKQNCGAAPRLARAQGTDVGLLPPKSWGIDL